MPLSDEDKAEIKAMFGELLPASVKEVLLPEVGKMLDVRLKDAPTADTVASAIKTAREELETKFSSSPDPKPGDANADPTESPAYKKAMAEMETLKASVTQERQAREQAERQRLQDLRTSQIQAALTANGVDPRLNRVATNHILAEDLVTITDDGKIVYRQPNQYGGVDEASVTDGVKAFLGTQDGKIFLPADPVRGGGGPGGDRSPANVTTNTNGEADPEQVALSALAGF